MNSNFTSAVKLSLQKTVIDTCKLKIKILFFFAMVLLSLNVSAHTWEIRVNQNQDGSLTWYIQTYHSIITESACVTQANQSGLIINGITYPIQAVFSGSIVPLSPTVFGVCQSFNSPGNRVSYGVIHTPFLGTTLNVQPYSNVACWANCGINANGTFIPPPPPVCTTCPITGWNNTVALPGNDNGTPCDATDDYTTANISVNHLACANITGDMQFRVIFDPAGANVAYGPFNYASGVVTNVTINIPYATSNSTQVEVIDDDFPCNVTHGLTVPNGQYLGIIETIPPSITCPTAVTVECASDVPDHDITTVTTSDNCGGVVTVTWEGDVPTAGDCPSHYFITRTYKATDAAGNSSTCTQIITVNDDTAPVISALPAESTIDCPATPSFDTPTATDACDGNPSLTFVDLLTPGNCAGNYSVTRTWTAADECGNRSTASQTINVHDITAPVITCPVVNPVNNTPGQCGTNVSFAATATDVCGMGTITYSPTSGSFFDVGTTLVTATATDACGNSSQCSFNVTVNDNEKPVITAPPVFRCFADDSFGCTINLGASATDNCTLVSLTRNGPVCFPVGTTTVTWTATDNHGNVSTKDQTVTRNPEINVGICAGPTRTIYRGTTSGVGPFGPQSVNLSSTASGGTPGYSYSWSPSAGLSNANIANPVANPVATTTYTLTVTDSKGCTRSLSITINVLALSSAVCSGSGNNVKFAVCHIPPGNPSNPHNICISVNALNAHLTSGSNGHNNCYLGPCQQNCFSTTPGAQPFAKGGGPVEMAPVVEETAVEVQENCSVKVYPNPSSGEFNIQVLSSSTEPVVVRILDMNGVVKSVSTVTAKSSMVKLGGNLAGGTYFAEVIQGSNKQMVRLVKLN